MEIILYTDFQEVDTSGLRPKNISRGKKILQSNHVDRVREVRDEIGFCRLTGRVLRQTPGVVSQRKNQSYYHVTIELDENRGLKYWNCACLAGKNDTCKHLAAVCLYVNRNSSCSKTSQPLAWNKPTESQLEKYPKGCQLGQIFPKMMQNCVRGDITKEAPKLPDAMMKLGDCIITDIVKAEEKFLVERESREIEKLITDDNLRNQIEILLIQKKERGFAVYHAYQVVKFPEKDENGNDDKFKYKMVTLLSTAQHSPNYSLIAVDKAKMIDICVRSQGQSQSSVWFKERYLRITCSSRAHDVKTRRDKFEELVLRFRKTKYNGSMTKDMLYGITMEPVARLYFENITGLLVTEVGLIISLLQPFLATSLDGLILNDDKIEILEIKCPSSCENDFIVNREDKTSKVHYLTFVDGDIILRDTHRYYTQIQVSMYIAGVSRCHFFVYSSKDYVYLKIDRDEKFLSETIPKLEEFYLKYFMPVLTIPVNDLLSE